MSIINSFNRVPLMHSELRDRDVFVRVCLKFASRRSAGGRSTEAFYDLEEAVPSGPEPEAPP